MSNEEKWKDDFEEWFSELRASFCSERQWSLVEDILDNKYHMQNGYITGRQHSEKEIEELCADKQAMIGTLVQRTDHFDKAIEKHKAALDVLREAVNFYAAEENWHISHHSIISKYSEHDCIKGYDIEVTREYDSFDMRKGGKRAREASKRAALILGEG
jgi:hypothetical protein